MFAQPRSSRLLQKSVRPSFHRHHNGLHLHGSGSFRCSKVRKKERTRCQQTLRDGSKRQAPNVVELTHVGHQSPCRDPRPYLREVRQILRETEMSALNK